jgi:hypothetical protein
LVKKKKDRFFHRPGPWSAGHQFDLPGQADLITLIQDAVMLMVFRTMFFFFKKKSLFHSATICIESSQKCTCQELFVEWLFARGCNILFIVTVLMSTSLLV